jgi:hypothetical protein
MTWGQHLFMLGFAAAFMVATLAGLGVALACLIPRTR